MYLKNIAKYIYFILISLKRKFIYNSVYPVYTNKKKTIVIIGNANNIDLDQYDFLDKDIFMLNYGPSLYKIQPTIYLFELPHDKNKRLEYLNNNKDFISNSFNIFRPNSIEELILVRQFDINYKIPNEFRIVPIFSKKILKTQIFISNIFNFIPFYRSSISFAIFYCAYSGYEKIELICFDPFNKNNIHPTSKKIDNINVYDFLNFCIDKNILNNVFKHDSCLF